MSHDTRSVKVSYVKLRRTIWTDHEFCRLSSPAQRIYLLLISAPNLSAVGVLPVTVSRWASLAPDTSLDEIRASLVELEMARYVVIDPATEELLIRSYIVHDEAHRSPNGQKALRRARDTIMSAMLKDQVNNLLIKVGVAPNEAPSQPPTEEANEGDSAPQQPATSNHDPSTTPSSQQPPAPVSPSGTGSEEVDPVAAAAEAFEAYLEWRITRPGVMNPGGLKHTLQGKRDEWDPKVRAYQSAHPEAGARQILVNAYEMTFAHAVEAVSSLRRKASV